jgi:ribosomal-protein-alanine N-acetyltransferase
MTVRPATVADLDAIMALERASFPTDAWSETMMREELTSRHSWYVIDEEAGRLVGYGGIRAANGSTDADIQTIAIAESARGRGRGRRLLETLLAEASRRGVREVFLEVRADNPVAQALYASEGFFELGRRPRYYQPDGVDALVMRLDVTGWAGRPGAGSGRSEEISPNEDGSRGGDPRFARSPGSATPPAGTDAGGEAPDQENRPDQDESGWNRPDFADSPELTTPPAATDAGACT